MLTETPNQQRGHVLRLFSLIMITIGAVDSVRNLPSAAMYGDSLIFLFLFAAVLFLIPNTLIASELVTAWPECGGIYVWVKHAFGKKFGFLAIWLLWISNLIWFPTILSFAAGTLGYLISPELANNKLFLSVTVVTSFWIITIVNLCGAKHATRFSNICTMFGLFFPMALIIAFGLNWAVTGHPWQISLGLKSFLPNPKDPDLIVALTGIMMSLCGMEITTAQAHEVHKPHCNYPRAFFIAIIVLLFTLIFGSLTIALILPDSKINIFSGVIQTFDILFGLHHLRWLLPIVTIALIFGAFGGVNSWILAPIRGIHMAAHDGHLPKHCRRNNKKNAPSTLLIYQAIFVSIIVLALWIEPTVSSCYWLLTTLAVQLYMLMYVLMFAAAIYLRFKKPDHPRPFRIPGGNFGMVLVGSVGIITALFTFSAGFLPSNNIQRTSALNHVLILAIGLLIMILPPFIRFKRKTISNEILEIETN